MVWYHQHGIDRITAPRRVTRTIGAGLTYLEPGKKWAGSERGIDLLTGAPDNWEGRCDYKHASLKGPLQSFAVDTTDAQNTAMTGGRLSARPEIWYNTKWLGVLAVQPIVDQHSAKWRGLFANVDVENWLSPDRIKEQLILRRGHPPVFRFSLRIPDHMSWEIINGSIALRDEDGEIVIWLLAPWGEDAKGKPIRAPLSVDGVIVVGSRSLPVFAITPSASDLGGAVYPVAIDPTAILGGTALIEDAAVTAWSTGNTNQGGYSLFYAGWSRSDTAIYRSVVRITSGIPAGNITGLRWIPYVSSFDFTGGSDAYTEIYQVNAGNIDWVEGTASFSQQAGSCCWNYKKFNTHPWSNDVKGCGEYVPDASPPRELTNIAPGFVTFVLPPAWAVDWRDGTGEGNGGLLMRAADETVVGIFTAFSSTEGATSPTFEIDFNLPAAAVLGRRRD